MFPMMKIPKLRNRLLGAAVGLFLSVAAVTFLMFALSFVLKRGLDRVQDRLLALNEEEADLQRRFLMADHLIHDLAMAARDGSPGGAASVDWRPRLEQLANTRWGSLDTRTPVNYVAIRQALIDIRAVAPGPRPGEPAKPLVASLVPTLKRIRAETESALSQRRTVRLRLMQEQEERADFDALAMLCVGFIGFSVVSLSTGRFLLRLSRDVGRLKDRARRIAEGDYEGRADFERRDEVGELAETISAMAGALVERAKEIENTRHCLFQAEKMFALGTLATGIAHEIGNPLHSILAICEELDESLAEESSSRNVTENRKRLQMITDELDRLQSVIRELGDFSSPVPVERGPMSVNPAIESAIQLLRFDSRFRGIRITADLSRDVPIVYGAASRLTQVAINLLINAADAVDAEDGAIVVSSAPDRDGVLITIEDNGRGMSKETCGRALDAFFTTKPRGEGTGLGLAVCKEIIEEHGGTTVIDSEPGRGTRIEIRIPSPTQEGLR